jgi:hypothetical protein
MPKAARPFLLRCAASGFSFLPRARALGELFFWGIPPPIAQMNDQIQPLLNLLTGKLGWLPTVVTWIGAARLAMKFFSAKLQAKLTARMVAAVTGPDPEEERDWETVLGKRWYRLVNFAVDLAFSVKLPTLADFLRLKSQGATKS